MSISIRPSIHVSQALELRTAMEQRLTCSLSVQSRIAITLAMYRERETLLTKIYREALKDGRVKLYKKHGLEFEYAIVSKKEVPAEIIRHCGYAFSHCLYEIFDAFLFGTKYAYTKGSWLLFVIYDHSENVKPEYLEFAAVHEHGEEATLGEHHLATKLEFAVAKMEGQISEYVNWLEIHEPGKFADVFTGHSDLTFPDDPDFEIKENPRVRELIESFEWPYSVLQKLHLYHRKNEEIEGIIVRTFELATITAGAAAMNLKRLIQEIETALTNGLAKIKKPELMQYISIPRIERIWEALRMALSEKFSQTLNLKREAVGMDSYLREITEANITGSLPTTGALSTRFKEAIKAIQ